MLKNIVSSETYFVIDLLNVTHYLMYLPYVIFPPALAHSKSIFTFKQRLKSSRPLLHESNHMSLDRAHQVRHEIDILSAKRHHCFTQFYTLRPDLLSGPFLQGFYSQTIVPA